MATYDITSSSFDIGMVEDGDILNCPYTGSEVSITLPPGIYTLNATGATGRCGYRTSSSAPTGIDKIALDI